MPPKTPALAILAAIVPAVLAIAALAFYATEVFILTFHAVPSENRDIVAGAVGFVGGSLVGSAFGFYFGASMHAKTQSVGVELGHPPEPPESIHA